MLAKLHDAGYKQAAIIGTVVDKPKGKILLS
jgi:hydrogenase maturation factor